MLEQGPPLSKGARLNSAYSSEPTFLLGEPPMRIFWLSSFFLPWILNVKPHCSPYLKIEKLQLDLDMSFIPKPNEWPAKNLHFSFFFSSFLRAPLHCTVAFQRWILIVIVVKKPKTQSVVRRVPNRKSWRQILVY